MNDIKITKEHVEAMIKACKVECTKLGEKTTIVCVTLPNGFELIQSSSCVDPKNYDHELGRRLCMKRVEDKIYELEGYLLQSLKYMGDALAR